MAYSGAMIDHNPALAAAAGDIKGTEAGIERPDAVTNLAWQTRAAPPTAAETALADALQAVFAERIYELPAIVARLNGIGLAAPGGGAWSEASLRAELQRLGC